MNFIRNITKKKEITNLFILANNLYKKIESCLSPSTSVFYHYKFAYLGMTRNEQTISIENLNNSFINYSAYLDQYVELYNKIYKLLENDTKFKSKFENDIIAFQHNFVKLSNAVDGLVNSILTVPNYKTIPELTFIKMSLNSLQRDLFFTKKFDKPQEKFYNYAL